MKKLILASALSIPALLLSACGDDADEVPVAEDTAAVDTAAVDTGATATTDWPSGTRIVEENGVTYRVNPDGTRVEIADGEWRIVTEGGTRFRVGPNGARIEIDDNGEDLDGAPDNGRPDVDIGTNEDGNLDIDVSTDGSDATPEDGDD